MPIEGKPKDPDIRNRVGARLKQAGAAVGIDFTGKTDRYPNSLKAHTLLEYALSTSGPAVQDKLQEVLFRHYFTDGLYPDATNLAKAATEVGLDAQEAIAFVESQDKQQAVKAEAQRFSSSGINGVPFFFANNQPLFSGAQPPSSFTEVFNKV